MQNSTVLVLLATYNGEVFIREMIDSVLAQDYPDIHVILSDDNSTDGTAAILEEYANVNPQRVTHYRSGQRFGSAQKHFMHLLTQFHDAPYIMFCDQDDVWHKDKIRKTLFRMWEIEDVNKPAMVHTDLRVVDKELREIAPSFCQYMKLDGSRLALNQILVQNVVTGCTMMINNTLAECVCSHPIPDAMRMHDWWLAILAASVGHTAFLDEATIDYRQHGNNSVGAQKIHSINFLLSRIRLNREYRSIYLAAEQAYAFLECYKGLLTEKKKELISCFCQTRNLGQINSDWIYLKHGLIRKGAVRIIAQFLGW